MEYLVTYGWALLALFLVIALLIASGAFSTGGFTPQECVFQPDMPCSSYILYRSPSESATILRFSLTNGLGFPINITNITYTATSLGQQDRRTYESGVSSLSPVGLASGATREFAYKFTGSAQPQLREMKTVIVALTYYNCKGGDCTGPYQTTGRISAFVEQGTAGLPDS